MSSFPTWRVASQVADFRFCSNDLHHQRSLAAMADRSIRDAYGREDELSDGGAKREQFRRIIEDLRNRATPPPRRTGNVHAHRSVGRGDDDREAVPNTRANRQSYSGYLEAQDLAERVRSHQQEKAAAIERLAELDAQISETKKDLAKFGITDFTSQGSPDWKKIDAEHVRRRDEEAGALAQTRLASRAEELPATRGDEAS